MPAATERGRAAGVLRRPFREQLAYFRGKLARQLPTARWDDLSRAEHDTAFVVAGAMKAELLSDFAAAVDRAIAEGKSLAAFRKDFEDAVARHGWEGWTGSDTPGGRAWRTRVIYRTNAAVSYAAGRYAQLVAGRYPFWVYRHGGSKEPRPEHVALDGLVLPADHPFWAKYYPPSDWGCSCYVVGARSAAAARRLGGDPDKPLPDWWRAADPATGAPPGIGQGWDYAPGASVANAVNAAASKVWSWDHRIAKAFMESLPDAVADRLSKSYRLLPSLADDVRRYAARVASGDGAAVPASRTLGLVPAQRAAAVRRLIGQAVERFDFAFDAAAVGHVARQHGDAVTERARGQRAVEAADYAMLPHIVSDGVLAAGEAPGRISLTLRRAGAEYVTVWERRGRRRELALVTFYIRVTR